MSNITDFLGFYFSSFSTAFKTSWKWAGGIATAVGIFTAFVLDRTKPEPPTEAFMKTLAWLGPIIVFVFVFFAVIFLRMPYLKYQKLKQESEEREKNLEKEVRDRDKRLEDAQEAKPLAPKPITSMEAVADKGIKIEVNPSFHNSPTFTQNQQQAQSQKQEQTTTTRARPNIIFHAGRILSVLIDETGYSTLSENGSKALMAHFANEVDSQHKTASASSVKARMFYKDQQGETEIISKGCWLDNRSAVTLDVGNDGWLLIAAKAGDGRVFAFESKYEEPRHYALHSARIQARYQAEQVPARIIELTEKRYNLRVSLYNEYSLNPPVDFNFELTTEPELKLRLIS